MRTATGSLHFYVNGQDYGEASAGIPTVVYAVVDMYGKCVQVTITESVETSKWVFIHVHRIRTVNTNNKI